MENKVKSKKEKGKSEKQASIGLSFFLFPFTFYLRQAWWWLRQVSGEAAYERYLEHVRHCPHAPLSRDEFYLDALRRKYSGVSRCC